MQKIIRESSAQTPQTPVSSLESSSCAELFASYCKEARKTLGGQRECRMRQDRRLGMPHLSFSEEQKLGELTDWLLAACQALNKALHGRDESFIKSRIPVRFVRQEFWEPFRRGDIHVRVVPRFTASGRNVDSSEPFFARSSLTTTLPNELCASMLRIPADSPIVVTLEAWNPRRQKWDLVSGAGCIPDLQTGTLCIDEVQGTPHPPISSPEAKAVAANFRPSTAIPLYIFVAGARTNGLTIVAVRKHERTTTGLRNGLKEAPRMSPYLVMSHHPKEFAARRITTNDPKDEYNRYALL